jgi:hypothetical protein
MKMKRISALMAAFVVMFAAGCNEDNTPPQVEDPCHPIANGKPMGPRDYFVKYCADGTGNSENPNCKKVGMAGPAMCKGK